MAKVCIQLECVANISDLGHRATPSQMCLANCCVSSSVLNTSSLHKQLKGV